MFTEAIELSVMDPLVVVIRSRLPVSFVQEEAPPLVIVVAAVPLSMATRLLVPVRFNPPVPVISRAPAAVDHVAAAADVSVSAPELVDQVEEAGAVMVNAPAVGTMSIAFAAPRVSFPEDVVRV